MARIRILRVLEYVGEEKDIWTTLRKGGVPANGEAGPERTNGLIIKSGLIGFPEMVKEVVPEEGE